MLRVKPQLNLRDAESYFREHLRTGDYYSAGQQVRGEWLGSGADKMGLCGIVRESDFLALCEGRDPRSDRRLTARQNTTRRMADRMTPNRRVFYDFTISPPKSVSVVALMQDDRIVALHEQAVRTALRELEKFAETRVRRDGADAERVTGNIVTAAFRHETSRELDPHLHTHCIAFNATFDRVERRWKALHASGMYRAQKFAENLYFHELAKGLRSLGYEVKNNARNFELAGVPQSIVDRFSKRHRQIDDEVRNQITKTGAVSNVAALRARIAHDKRRRKMKESTAARLRGHWRDQLPVAERLALEALRPTSPVSIKPARMPDIVTWAEDRLFERRAVVADYELWSAALARGRGEGFNLSDLQITVDRRGYVQLSGSRKLTTRGALRTELALVLSAREGRWECAPLASDYRLSNPALSGEQRGAVERILGSRDFITLFRGGAGTGKSFTLKEVERALTASGHSVVVVAPQRQQVTDLSADGLPAQTLAHLLTMKRLPARPVVLLDEAGQVGGADLHALVRLVQQQKGRLILSGDTRQHGAVAASDALRALETYAGLQIAELRTIRRQNPKLGVSTAERQNIRAYRTAVNAAAHGDSAGAFDRLEQLGWVRECEPRARDEAVADAYMGAHRRNEQVLVVAQTWDEVRRINDVIRSRLQCAGRLGPPTTVPIYEPVHWEDAMKRDPRFYAAGHHAVFVAGYGRFARGNLAEIVRADDRGLTLLMSGRRSRLSFRYASRFMVTARKEFEMSSGDRLQIKANGRTVEGQPLANGELVTVHNVRSSGELTVADRDGQMKTLAPSQLVCVRGYAVTSYASQGKTVDTVLLADSACRAATNAQQWYVTISRARRRALIFTTDRTELRANIERLGERELALEMASADFTRAQQLATMAVEYARATRTYHAIRGRGKARFKMASTL